MFKALIFDFDGTIIDTEVPDYQSWQEMFQAHETELSYEEWQSSIGHADSFFDVYGTLERQIGREVDRAEVRKKRQARFMELVEQQPFRPGVEAYIEQAVSLGLRLGVASSARRSWVMGHLNSRNLLRHFECVFTADDVEHAKPDPTLYRLAIQALDVLPEQAIALEDSPAGALGAVRAGLFTVAIPNPLTSQLDFTHAHLQLDSLADLPLNDLLAYAEAAVRRQSP